MVSLAMDASAELALEDIDAEVLDVRTVKPIDKTLLLKSVKKTGRLVVADGGWKSFGVAAEIEAIVFECAFAHMKSAPVRVTLPDVPAPASSALEKAYYPTARNITEAALKIMTQ
jgi:pyruvate dehydrogenase E1 component beta subunit